MYVHTLSVIIIVPSHAQNIQGQKIDLQAFFPRLWSTYDKWSYIQYNKKVEFDDKK